MWGSLSGYRKREFSPSVVPLRNSCPKLGQILFSLTAPCKCQEIPPISRAQQPAALQEVLQSARTDWSEQTPHCTAVRRFCPCSSEAELWEAAAVDFVSTWHLKSSPVLHPFPWSSGFPAKPAATHTAKVGITAWLPAQQQR